MTISASARRNLTRATCWCCSASRYGGAVRDPGEVTGDMRGDLSRTMCWRSGVAASITSHTRHSGDGAPSAERPNGGTVRSGAWEIDATPPAGEGYDWLYGEGADETRVIPPTAPSAQAATRSQAGPTPSPGPPPPSEPAAPAVPVAVAALPGAGLGGLPGGGAGVRVDQRQQGRPRAAGGRASRRAARHDVPRGRLRRPQGALRAANRHHHAAAHRRRSRRADVAAPRLPRRGPRPRRHQDQRGVRLRRSPAPHPDRRGRRPASGSTTTSRSGSPASCAWSTPSAASRSVPRRRWTTRWPSSRSRRAARRPTGRPRWAMPARARPSSSATSTAPGTSARSSRRSDPSWCRGRRSSTRSGTGTS